jgi:predicted transcriptional regulator
VAANDEKPITDRVTLSDVDAQVYEAIATLEFIGYQVKTKDIVTASDLDEATVRQALRSLTRRGVLVTRKRGAEEVYAPAHRGWSAAPEKAANPNR